MSLAVRVIPCLDVDAGRVVKGVHFENLKDAGDPVELAAEYYRQGADEITFLDVTASSSHRNTMIDVVSCTAEQVFIPMTVGGGVRTPEDVDSLLRCGADKVGVNTAAINDPSLISRVADRFGNQVLVLSVDARREKGEQHTQSGFEVTTMGGRKSTGIDAIWWVKRAEQLGAGEILLNSMDADGTKEGFDLEMIRAVRKEVKIPIIASGGAGKVEDFPPAIEAGADAVRIDKEDFIDLLALTQSVPGIFAVNIAIFIGYKLRKFRGALAMALGTILPSFFIILAIALFFQQFKQYPIVENIFKGIRPAVVALIAAPTFSMAKSAKINRYTVWIPIVSALLIWVLDVSPVYIIIIAGVGGFIYGKYKHKYSSK